MLRSAILAVAAAGLIAGHAVPASANAAMSGAASAPAASKGVVIDVRRGGGFRGARGGGFRGFRGGGPRFHRGGRIHRLHRGGRHWRGYRHRRYYGGIYFAAPYVYYRGYGYGQCNWLYRKAIRTGSRYWWRRYYRCRNYYY